MDLAFKNELRALMEHSGNSCVSLYMPTHRAGNEMEQDPIRFANLIREAEKQLTEKQGMRSSEARELLDRANDLQRDSFFWRSSQQGNGLAIFIAPDLFQYYQVPRQLEEMLVIGNRFHLTPLIHLLSEDGRFFVLAVSQQAIRLFECSTFEVKEVELEAVPKSLDEALGYEEPDQGMNYQGVAVSQAGGRGAAMTYRHGVAAEDPKNDIFRFFRIVDNGLREILRHENVPLILAGVESVLPMFREATTYSHVTEQSITGNPEGLSAQELHREALALVVPHFHNARQEASDVFMNLNGTGRASNDLKEIVAAASFGRIQFLFIPEGIQQWGRFDSSTNTVELFESKKESGEDLLDFAAIQTFLNGGSVFRVKPQEVPGKGKAAAVFRY
jgi:hypothetical protein